MFLSRSPGVAALAALVATIGSCVTAAGSRSADSHDAWVREVNPFPVYDSMGRALTLAFLGGLSVPRPQLVDIDGDGVLELFVQERGNAVMRFRRSGTDAAGVPGFALVSERFADLGVGEWFRFGDLDGDGDPDLLSETPFSYIRYWRNVGTRSAPRFVVTTDTLRDASGTPIFSDRQNIPQLGDIDCNDRPDLLLGKLDGTVARYELAEITGSGEPRFRLVAEEFEGIRIIGQTMGSARHGANTMALADTDEDGDLDLFWGDYFEQGLLRIENTGSCASFNFRNRPEQFPVGDPVLTSGYNAPSFGTVTDSMERLELVMGVLGGAYNPIRTASENLYFVSRTSAGGWTVRTRSLLPMIDVGSESIPSLVDLDDDGDLDLLVSNKIDSREQTTSRIHRFENVGTPTAPLLRMRGVLPVEGRYHLAPAFGDLDGDGRLDMVVGQWMASPAWYRGVAGRPGSFELVDSALVTITRGSNTVPALGDLDGDGDLDLVIGESSGYLNYYRNDGTPREPRFVLVSDEWQGMRAGRRSAPALVDFDADQDLDLLIGVEDGSITLFRNVGSRSVARFERDTALAPSVAALAAPAVGDLDGDGMPEIIAGGAAGGLVYARRIR